MIFIQTFVLKVGILLTETSKFVLAPRHYVAVKQTRTLARIYM